MSVRLPPLESLRYFEAAARHLSFTLAADELCVSQSAVSQNVIKLEERLGYKLFERRIRKLELTDQGATLYPVIHASLSEIKDSLNKLETSGEMRKLTIYCMPSFASTWLMPRLHDFQTRYPNIDVNLVAEAAEPNFHNEIIDIGICHGIGDQPAMEQQLLFWDYVYPVASPALLARCELNELADLSKAVLIHDSLPQAKLSTSWQRWFIERGIRNIDCGSGYRFNQADLIVRAAIDGRGVALGRHILVANEVKQGTLIPLFNEVEKDDGVYVVCLKKLVHRPQVEVFLNWLKEQAVEFQQTMPIEQLTFPQSTVLPIPN